MLFFVAGGVAVDSYDVLCWSSNPSGNELTRLLRAVRISHALLLPSQRPLHLAFAGRVRPSRDLAVSVYAEGVVLDLLADYLQFIFARCKPEIRIRGCDEVLVATRKSPGSWSERDSSDTRMLLGLG